MTLNEVEYPLDTQIGVFNDPSEVETWLIKNTEIGFPHDYATLIKDSRIIYTPLIQEYLLRYKMQKQYNIYSYSQNFESIPGEWIEILNYIDHCVQEALEEKKRLGR